MQSVRFIRKNPLVGWEDMSGLTARQVFEPLAVLMTPGAKAKYEEVYTRVSLPLALLVHPVFPVPRSSRAEKGATGVDEGVRKASEAELARRKALGLQLAKRLNAVVLSLTAVEKASVPYYTTGLGKRGSTFRMSPMSPDNSHVPTKITRNAISPARNDPRLSGSIRATTWVNAVARTNAATHPSTETSSRTNPCSRLHNNDTPSTDSTA